ncbi:hypothetical protein Pla163_06100 [Planctomycetes bacterium Pla163]|uniref:Uncharacterized protein n=1 Tax=Rohdeia mirabilis TaxID=2528008 RepID=A0A518CWA2_9BACT|nr:hypothetical protein Pla163_06100 [Planctomycetes bacterium Pla163]
MQTQVFAVPTAGDEATLGQMDVFLRSHRVLSVDRTAVVHDGRQFWPFCVERLERVAAPGGGARPGSATTYGVAHRCGGRPRGSAAAIVARSGR